MKNELENLIRRVAKLYVASRNKDFKIAVGQIMLGPWFKLK